MFYKAIVAALLLITPLFAKENPVNPLENKPFVTVAIQSIACYYNIRINDIPVYTSEKYDEPMRLELPINRFLNKDNNTLSIQIRKSRSSERRAQMHQPCTVSATLILNTLEGKSESDFTIGSLSYTSPANDLQAKEENIQASNTDQSYTFKGDTFVKSEKGDLSIGKAAIKEGKLFYGFLEKTQNRELQKGVSVATTFSVPMPFDSLSFLKEAEVLTDKAKVKRELAEVFETMWKAIKEGDKAYLEKLFEIRNRVMAQALYKSDTTKNDVDTVNEILKDAKDSRYNLWIPSQKQKEEDLYINFDAKNKIATLTNWPSGSVLAYEDTKTEGSVRYELSFSKINGEWKVVE